MSLVARYLVVLILLAVQACSVVPDNHISKQEAEREKRAYACKVLFEYAYLSGSEMLPHCAYGAIDQAQAKAIIDWIRYEGGEEDFARDIKLLDTLKPYLRKGDYYYYLKWFGAEGCQYYREHEVDEEKASYWCDTVGQEATSKVAEYGAGNDAYWSNETYSSEKRKKLLIKAADMDNLMAQETLGMDYLTGRAEGIEQNKEKGLAWLERAGSRQASVFLPQKMEELRPYLSNKDALFWRVMYQMSALPRENPGVSMDVDFNPDLLNQLMEDVKDWNYFCSKFRKKEWLWVDDWLPEKFNAMSTIVVNCATLESPQ